MSYLALYRKYRPKSFNDIIGQNHIVKTLQNQINKGRVGHAYLFSGTRGTGKTTIAKIFANAINCQNPIDGSACGQCEICKQLLYTTNLNIIEIDAASHNGVDNIREINEEVKYAPAIGKYKIYIIDEVHMLSIGAFNAMLKTLEEPPAHTIFILATTDPQKIPVTIISRCQRFDFKRINVKNIEECLKHYMELEDVKIEQEALMYIAHISDGSMRDALSILEQCISFYYNEFITHDKVLELIGAVDNKLIFDMINSIAKFDSTTAIGICDEINNQGRNIRQFNNDLIVHVRNLLVAKTTNGNSNVLDYSKEHIEQLKTQANNININDLMRYIKIFSELDIDLKVASNPKVILEVAILKLCEPNMDIDNPIYNKIAELENKIAKLQATGIQVEAIPSKKKEVLTQKPTKLPDAVPEDILKLQKEWRSIVQLAPISPRLVFESTRIEVLEGNNPYIVYDKSSLEPSLKEFMPALVAFVIERENKTINFKLMSAKEYNIKKQELCGSGETPVYIDKNLQEFQSKVNFDITVKD
ncbi:DNA polymerase III subunit gamma/tau [Candidatus Epulonipiscium fishelsonii]|nr:DNA polymerase III subunit gamma/tau [Epulopiscium sp. SCG-C06WGA-EpuloA1]